MGCAKMMPRLPRYLATLIALVLLVRAGLHPGASEPGPLHDRQGTRQQPSFQPGWSLDLQASSAVHGWVDKAGPAAVQVWHHSADPQRRALWDAFLAERAAGRLALDEAYSGVPPHGPDPWGCRLYFNHQYKIFFVRTAKTGSTTILENVFPACVKSPGLPHCLERVADSSMSVEEVAQLWREYTAFTFTRNVWGRAISQYQYLVHFLKHNATSRRDGDSIRCPRVRWDDFCHDPLLLGAVCRKQPECCTKKWTHQDWHMVSRHCGCMLLTPRCSKQLVGCAPSCRHAVQRQQTACFLTGDDPPGWAVDFIGRVEHFEEDLSKLFARVNRER